MFIVRQTLVIALCVFSVFGMAGDNCKTIAYLTKENTAFEKKEIKSKKYGFSYNPELQVSEMWYDGTSEIKEYYSWYSKIIMIDECDELEIEYCAELGTYFMFEIWWKDSNLKHQLRPIGNVLGDGKWHKVSIPAQGKKIMIGLRIKNSSKEEQSTGIKKVTVKPLKLRQTRAGELSHKLHNFTLPLIIPTPKKEEDLGRKIQLTGNGKAELGICLNNNDPQLKKIIAEEIASACRLKNEDVKTALSFDDLRNCAVVIDLCLNEKDRNVPNKSEAYTIEYKISNGQNIITLGAKEKLGLYWAWISLKQLIVVENNDFALVARNIVDWPDYSYRSVIGNAKSALMLKMNIISAPNWLLAGYYRSPDHKRFKDYFDMLKSLCEYAVPRGANVANILGPHDEKGSITISDDKEIEWLFSLYERTLKLGSKVVVLSIDDGGRKSESFTEADQKAFGGDILLSHAWFMKKMSDKIWQKYPDAIITATTKNYETSHGISGYYNRVGVSQKLIMEWTGAQCVTFDYPENLIRAYEEGIEGRNFIIFDNTATQPHGMYRKLNVCETYAQPRGGEGYRLLKNSKCLGVKFIATPASQMSMIRCMTASEYMWNASHYDPEYARQRAIAQISGNLKTVEPALKFSKEYLKLAYKYPVDKLLQKPKWNSPCPLNLMFDNKDLTIYQIQPDEYQELQKRLTLLKTLLVDIKSSSHNQQLTTEFELYYENAKDIIGHLYENSRPLPIIEPKGVFSFDINSIPGGQNYWQEKALDNKICTALYGSQTPNNTLTVAFNMNKIPSSSIKLILGGQDCDKNLARLHVILNNNDIFKGLSPFGHKKEQETAQWSGGERIINSWGIKEFNVPSTYFQKGRNELKIINTSESSDFIDHWVLISNIKFAF